MPPAPTPPSITTLTATAGNGRITINYAQSGATTIQYKVNSGSYITITTATSGSFVVMQLTPTVTYTITLLCQNSNGQTTKSVTGTPYGLATNINIVNMVSNGLNSILVPYTYNDNGSSITNALYIIEPSGSVTTANPNIYVGTANPFTITGLTGGITYYVRIILRNAAGDSAVSANAFATVIGYPTKPVISSITTPAIDTLGINYTSSYYGDNANVLTAYTDFTSKIENPTFNSGSTVIPSNSYANIFEIPNWYRLIGNNGAIYIGNGSTGYIQNLPPIIQQYAILNLTTTTSYAQLYKYIQFDPGYYHFIFMGYKQNSSSGDVFNISIFMNGSNAPDALNVNKILYEYHWVEYNVGFYIPTAGLYTFRINYSSQTGTLPNSVSISNAYIVRGFTTVNPDYYTTIFNNYKLTSAYTSLANNSAIDGTNISGWKMSASYIAKGITPYAEASTGEGYIVLSAGSIGQFNELVYNGSFLITFNACTKYASASSDSLQVYVSMPTGNIISDTAQSVNINSISWKTYTIRADITLPGTNYPEFYSDYDLGRYINFKYNTTNATQPNYLSIKDVFIRPILLYKSTNLTDIPPLSLSYTGFQSYPISVMIHNKIGGRSLLSDPVSGTARSVPTIPTVSSITCTVSRQLNIFWSSTSPIGTTITDILYSVNGGSFISGGISNPLVVTNLSGGVMYSFVLKASNQYGTSNTSLLYYGMPVDTLSKPIITDITEPSNNTIAIYWKDNLNDLLDDENGMVISSIKYSLDGGSTYISAGTSNPIILTGLSGGLLYPVKIKANNVVSGDSVESLVSYGSPYDKPDKPIITSITAPYKNTLFVYWTDVSNGANITSLKFSVDGSTPTINASVSSPFAISGITGGVTYQIRIMATNIGGNSLESDIYLATPFDVPGKPSIENISYINGQYYIDWTGLTNGSGITEVKYTLDASNTFLSAGTSDPFAITDLSSGHVYPLRVKTINAAGESALSDIYNIIPIGIDGSGGNGGIPELNINTPSILDVSAGNQSITVNFSHTETLGYPTITYQYRLNGGNFINTPYKSSPLIITGLTNGTSYYVNMTAINATGTSSISNTSLTVTPHSTPDKPTLISLDVSNQSIICSFQSASNNGGSEISYKYSLNEGSYVSVSSEALDISNGKITISGLTNGTSYSVSIKQTNEYGDSPASNTLTGAVPYTMPSPPTIIAVSSSSTQALINYTDGESNGYPILVYSYTIDGGLTYNPITNFSSPFTIYGLSPATNYSIQMKSINAKSQSVASDAYSFTTSSVTTAPVIVSAIPGNKTITVNFINGNLTGSTLFGYSYSINNGQYQTVALENVADNSFVIHNLINGVEYSVSIKMITDSGSSNASNKVTNIIPYNNPSPPTISNITVISTQATVYFDLSNSNGYPITKLEYSLDSGDTFITAPSLISPFIIYGLNDGTTYQIVLRASHEKGVSELSQSYEFTPADLPSAPTITTIIAGNQLLTVNFVNGALNGGDLTGYSVSVNGGIFSTISASDISGESLIVRNLTNGTNYNIAMKTITTKGASSSSLTTYNNIPYDNPSPPTITSISVFSGYALITFTEDASNGYPILGYRYSLDDITYINAPGYPSSPIALYGFTDGSENTIRLKAYHAKGTSSASNAVSFTTKDIPESPIIDRIEEKDTYLIVHFTNRNLRGGTITGYSVSINDSSYSIIPSQDISGNSFTINNLTNGTKYSISMKTITNVGISVMSNVVFDNVPYNVPSTPTITSIDVAAGTATINFTAGNSNGYPILGYQISINDASFINAEWVASSSTITLNGLENGVATTVKIRAYHAKGISQNSNTYTFTTNGTPDAPTIIDATAGNTIATIKFQNNNLYGGNIVKYSYSLNASEFMDVSSSDISGNTFIISGLTNGESYSVSMKVTTNIGTSLESNTKSEIIPFTAPSAPIISSVIEGNREATITFQPSVTYSTENGIINYQYSLDNGVTYNWCSSLDGNSFKITGLTAKTPYTVIVRSYSKFGFSNNSSPSSQFTPYGTPDTPIITNVVPSNQQILVYIESPESNGNTITSYLYSVNGEEYQTTNDITSPITITGLINKKQYIVTLKAVNEAGASDASLPSSPVIPFYIPDTPIISIIRPMNQSAIVDLSATDLNGDTIIGYKYSFNQTTWYDVSANPSSPYSFTINGLTNGQSYTIYVKIVSQSGITSASSISQSFVPRNVPNPPTITNVVPADKSVIIYFTDSSSNGSSIKEYWYSANGSPYKLAVQHSSPIIAYGLENGISYTLTIKAVNDAGFSNASIPSSSIMPFGVPATPFIRNVYPGNGSALVYFDEINGNGAPIEKIQYSMGPSWIDLSANTSPFTIPNLTNKTGPSVSIRAKNSAGFSYSSNIVRVMVGTPYPPTITSVVPGNKQLSVYFSTSVTNSPITAVYYTFVGSSSSPIKAIGTTSPIIIPKLTNGAQYSIKLQLANLNGYSLESEASTPIVPAGVPNAPIISSVLRSDINQVTITLGAIVNNGSPITKYYYTMNSETTLRDISGTTSPFIIDNLQPNLSYSFKIYAQNSVGTSPASGASRPIINVYSPPQAPTKVTTIARLNQLSVSFAPPTTPLFLPITTYLYALNGNGSASDVYIDASTTTLPLLIPINNNTSYSVRIKAVNAAGASSASSPTTPVTYIYLPPTYPTIKSVSSVGNGTAYISYTASVPRNAPITGYSYTLNAGQTYITMEISGGILIARDLSNNVPITTFQIAANSAIGYSNLSSIASSFTIINGAPSAPVLAAPSISGRTVTISFPQPSENGSPIIDYTYTLVNTTTKTTVINTVTSVPIILNNVQNGSYTVSVKARNSLGTSNNSATKTFSINLL